VAKYLTVRSILEEIDMELQCLVFIIYFELHISVKKYF